MNINLHSVSGSTAPPQPGANWKTTDADLMGHQEWSALECLRTLYRRKATVMCITGTGILAVGLISLLQPRWYQSEASLEIQAVNEDFLNAREIYPSVASGADSNGTYVQTQAEILQQDALIEHVVNKLHLETRPEFQRVPSVWNRFSWLTGPVPTPAQDVQNATEILKKNVKVVSSRGSRIIRIVCDARDPIVAADIANTLAQSFIEQSIEARRRAAEQTHMSLGAPLEALRDKLLKSEAALTADRTTSGRIFDLRRQRPSAGVSGEANTLTKREADADRRFYEMMSQRDNDARVAAVVPQSNIRLVGPAQPAQRPYKPNLPLNLAIGMFGGLILGICWVTLREQANAFLHSPGEAGMYLGLPELGVVPQVANLSWTGGILQHSAGGNLSFDRASREQRPSVLSESFRAILASILSAAATETNRILWSSPALSPWKARQR